MMRKLVLVLIISTLSASAWSQQSANLLEFFVQKNLINQHEADSLRAAETTSVKDKPSHFFQKAKGAFFSDVFKLYGYGQILYNASEHQGMRSQIPMNTHNTMEVARLILFAEGKLGVNNQFGYMLMYDFGPGAKLHELYGEWLPHAAFKLRFGQYKIPFTIENPMSPTRIETIYFTRSATALSGSAGDFNQFTPQGTNDGVKAGRDAGIQVYGQLPAFGKQTGIEYYTGLFNGTGFNTKDNNNHKDFIGSLYLHPLPGLKLGGSVYSGKLLGQINGVLGNHVRNRWAMSSEYNHPLWYARAEYIEGNDGGLIRKGGYGTLTWKLKPFQWELVAKADYYNQNTALAKQEVFDYTAGINYYFSYLFAHLSRLQLNYVYSDNHSLGSNHLFAAQLQVFF